MPWNLLEEHSKLIQLIIPQVCVDYKDLTVLKEESEEGRRLGFQAKVSIMAHAWPAYECLTCFS
jgi:citrate lyase beta subunit